jgi:hypothetical protein
MPYVLGETARELAFIYDFTMRLLAITMGITFTAAVVLLLIRG